VHFNDFDFVKGSQDTNLERKNRREGNNLMRRKLVPGAFSSQFPNCPMYISKDVLPPRSDVATSGA